MSLTINRTTLETSQRDQLQQCEAVIERGLTAFIEVGRELRHICEEALYKTVGFKTFEDYCHQRWDMKRAHAYRLISSVKVQEILSPIGDTPATEAIARPLARLVSDPEQLKDAWVRARDTCPTKRLTAEHVESVVKEFTQPTIEPDVFPGTSYKILYADPPWRYNDAAPPMQGSIGAIGHYPTMSIDELCELTSADGVHVSEIADDNSVLFLWATAPLLEEAFTVVASWKFEYKTQIVWDKRRHNCGHYTSVQHENLLICTRGSCLPEIAKKERSIIAVRRSSKHSEKPKEFCELIDKLYPSGRRIELFARTCVPGWDVWGNEVPKACLRTKTGVDLVSEAAAG